MAKKISKNLRKMAYRLFRYEDNIALFIRENHEHEWQRMIGPLQMLVRARVREEPLNRNSLINFITYYCFFIYIYIVQPTITFVLHLVNLYWQGINLYHI